MEKDFFNYQPANYQPVGPMMPQAPEFADMPPPAYAEIDSKPMLDQAQAPLAPPPEPDRELVDSKHLPEFKQFTEDEARAAMMVHAQKKDSYLNKKVVKKMQITKIDHSIVHAYFLQSYTEKRESSWAYTKYKFGRIDDTSLGPMPTVWEFEPPSNQKPPLFQTKTQEFSLPRSEAIQPCHNCSSHGSSCWTCSGNNKLKYYMKVKISYCNWKDCAMVSGGSSKEKVQVPKEQLKTVSGDIIYKQDAKVLKPITYVQNDEISAASDRLLNLHKSHLKSERLIMQRHEVALIPMVTVHYTHEALSGRFYIYGHEKRIHCPDFPCSTCVIQ